MIKQANFVLVKVKAADDEVSGITARFLSIVLYVDVVAL